MGTKQDLIDALGGKEVQISAGIAFTAAATNIATAVDHGKETGDGPYGVASTGTAPGGLTAVDATGYVASDEENFADGEVLTIGETDYRFKDTIAQAYDVLIEDDVAAESVLTMSGNFSNGEIVTIGDIDYTFLTALSGTGSPYDVLLGTGGAATEDSLSNLAAAINGGAGEDTLYGNGTVAHPDVSAVSDATTLTVTATVGAVAGNAIVVTSDASNGDDFNSDATLQDGVDGVEGTLDNLLNAINDDTGSGTKYHAGTAAHPDVEAVEIVDSLGFAYALTLAAKVAGVEGNDIALETDAAGDLTLSDDTLLGGYDNLFYVVKLSDDTFSLALSVADALADTPVVVDITSTGSGTHTLVGTAQGLAQKTEDAMEEVLANANRVSIREPLYRRFWDEILNAF